MLQRHTVAFQGADTAHGFVVARQQRGASTFDLFANPGQGAFGVASAVNDVSEQDQVGLRVPAPGFLKALLEDGQAPGVGMQIGTDQHWRVQDFQAWAG
jgi:hypothetical protein